MQELKLTRPIVDIDLETTGTDPATCRIVQIAMVKTLPDGTTDAREMIIDPCCDIPKEASDVHGISNEVLAEMKTREKVYTFNEVAKPIYNFIDGCDFRGFGIIDFDIPVMAEEFYRASIDFWGDDAQFPKPDALFLDGMVIFKKMEERTLTAALKFFCNEEMVNAHEAMADVLASQKVLLAQTQRYPELQGKSVAEIAEFCKRINRVDLAGKFERKEDGRVYLTFGKHKGKKVAELLQTPEGISYYQWFKEKGEFTYNTKRHFTDMYDMIYAPKKV